MTRVVKRGQIAPCEPNPLTGNAVHLRMDEGLIIERSDTRLYVGDWVQRIPRLLNECPLFGPRLTQILTQFCVAKKIVS